MRLFTAFPVSEEVKKHIIKAQDALSSANQDARIKWVEDCNVHVTSCFLGEVGDDKVEMVEILLSGVASQENKFNFVLENTSCFPSAREPRVLFIELGDSSGTSSRIRRNISEALKENGFLIDDKPWRPHLTLGRVKSEGVSLVGLKEIKIERLAWPVEYIELIKSELCSDGPRHTVIKKIYLND